jgi:hypothetical protein
VLESDTFFLWTDSRIRIRNTDPDRICENLSTSNNRSEKLIIKFIPEKIKLEIPLLPVHELGQELAPISRHKLSGQLDNVCARAKLTGIRALRVLFIDMRRLSRPPPPLLPVISCIIDSALLYIMVARNRNTILTSSTIQLSFHRRTALTTNSNGTQSAHKGKWVYGTTVLHRDYSSGRKI